MSLKFGFPFLTREKVLTFSLYAAGLAANSEVATSSHIEEMIQELAQQEGVEAPAIEMPQERAIIEVGGPQPCKICPGICRLWTLGLVRQY